MAAESQLEMEYLTNNLDAVSHGFQPSELSTECHLLQPHSKLSTEGNAPHLLQPQSELSTQGNAPHLLQLQSELSTEDNAHQLLEPPDVTVGLQQSEEVDGQASKGEAHPRIQRLLDQICHPQGSQAWFEQRKKYLTASNCAAALDIKPYASYKGSPRLELLIKLKNPDDKPFSNKATAHGHENEPVALRLLQERYGVRTAEAGMLTNDKYPFLGASPDGLCLDADENGKVSAIEIKCPLTREVKKGVIPEHYWPQLMVQMYVMDVDKIFFTQFKPLSLTWPGAEVFDVVEVCRGPETDRWWDEHYPLLAKFWRDLQSYQLPVASSTFFVPNKRPRREVLVRPTVRRGVYADSDDDL